MKKFILFQMEHCYPAGGMGDLSGSFDTLDDALAAIEPKSEEAEVVDRDTWEIVATASREYIPLHLRPANHDTLTIRRISKGCRRTLASGQYWGYCGETDMGQTLPVLCTECGGTLILAKSKAEDLTHF